MAKGLPKSIIKKYGISKKAWSVYRGRKGKTRKSRKTRTSNPKRRYTKTRRRKKTRNRKGFTIPIAVVAPIVAIPFMPAREGWASPFEDAKNGKWTAVAAQIVEGFNPFIQISDPVRFSNVKFGLHLPRYLAVIAGGYLAHKIASKFGLNRALAQAGVPFIRI